MTTSYTIRSYECSKCEEIFSEIAKRKKKRLKKCPDCGIISLESIIFATPTVFVQQDAKTLQQQAERNEKRMGSYELQEKRHDHEERRKKGKKKILQEKVGSQGTVVDTNKTKEPWYGRAPANILNKSEKDIEKYINTGET